MSVLYIVVPCYNEEECLPATLPVFLERLRSLKAEGLVSEESRLLLVNDGSRDATGDIIRAAARDNRDVCGVLLSCNRGHQNAVTAGMVRALQRGADCTVTIDADLQDDILAIDEMVKKFNAGAPIVCGVRSARETDTFMKRVTAHAYYRIANLFGARVIYDHADFRLLSREAMERLFRYGTDDLFLRGLVTRLGLPIEKVLYERKERTAGESKYTVKKMLALASKGLTVRKMKPAGQMVIGDLHIGEEVG